MARQKLFNYAGITLGFGALAVLLIGFAFALQTATTTDSLIPGQAAEPTALPAIFTPPPMMFATQVAFGDAIRLEGYNLTPGEGFLNVDLIWHALAAPPADYMVGVFLMPDGAQSAIVAQSDSVPAAGTRPTSGWQPGEYISDVHTLSITLSPELNVAELVMWVNVYDPATGDRLPSDPPGGGPFNATAVGSIFVPAEAPLTATPLPYPTDWTPEPCAAEGCTPTATPCAVGCAENLDATLTAVWATQGVTPTPCQVGCPATEPAIDPASADATAAMAATLGWTPTPLGFVPTVTPCQAGCESLSATATPTPPAP